MSEPSNNLNELDLDQITDKEQLELIQMRVNIAQTLTNIEKMRQDNDRVNQETQATIQKMRIESEKLQKESKWYPALPLFIAFLTSSGLTAVVTAVLTAYFLKK